jgi:hypothetical protein
MSKAAKEHEILEALAKIPDEASQIDYVMKKRSCFSPGEGSRNYPIVQEYLSNKLDVKEATEKLLAPINSAILKLYKNLDLGDLWYSIVHSAKRLPFRDVAGLTKLVELMRAIKANKPPPDAARKDLFLNLSEFYMCARESMNDVPGGGSGYTLPEAHAYANMVYFYALLTKEKVAEFWIYCIWEMRGALENVPKDDHPQRDHVGTVIQIYESRVPGAATWVFAMGKEVYAREQDLTETRPTHGNPGAGGELWTGRAEFSKERWALWKSRFGEVAQMEELSEEVRGIAREAAEAMAKIEKDGEGTSSQGPTPGKAVKITYAHALK